MGCGLPKKLFLQTCNLLLRSSRTTPETMMMLYSTKSLNHFTDYSMKNILISPINMSQLANIQGRYHLKDFVLKMCVCIFLASIVTFHLRFISAVNENYSVTGKDMNIEKDTIFVYFVTCILYLFSYICRQRTTLGKRRNWLFFPN